MVNVLHSEQTVSDGIHGMVAFEYANEAARLAATGFTVLDVNKVAVELDTDTWYVLTDHSPITWKALSGAGGGADLSDNPPSDVTKAAASAGTGTEASRDDHKHDVSTAVASAQTPGDTAIEGTASSLARSDHQHSLPAYGSIANTFCEGDDARLSDARTPTSHATSHQNGGVDEINVAGLSGALADAQTPTTHNTSHQNGGVDEVATATPGANAIPKAGAGGDLDGGWMPYGSGANTVCEGNDSRLSDARTPTAHNTSHQDGGSDQIRIDTLQEGTDVTTLDSTTVRHGLLPKLGGGTTDFLRADGAWAEPPGAGGGEVNTASNIATASGVGLFKQKVGVDLEFKKVNAGSAKVTITDDTGNDEVDVDVVTGTDANSVCIGNDSRLSDARAPTGTAGGDLGGTYPNPTVNDGADSTALHDNVSAEISGITEKTTPVSADLLVIEDSAASNAKKRVQVGNLPGGGAGEANTASNVGTAGVGVYKQKTGVDLELKKINAGSAKVTITDDIGNDEVDVDVVTGSDANSVCVGNDSRLSDARTPTSHATSHQNGGGDEISVAGLSGALADAQTPTAHNTSHQNGGADEVATATPGANAIPKAGVGGDLAGGWMPYGSGASTVCEGNDSRLSDSRAPTGAAGGDLNGTYPNPSVDDGADSTAIHDNVSAEISGIAEKTTPVSADLIIIEDSAATNAKKRVQIGNLPGGGGVWGNNFADGYTAGPSSTTSATMSTFVSVSMGALPEGKYMLHWYVEYEGGAARNDLDILFGTLREGTDATAWAEIYPNWEDNSWMPFSGSIILDVPAGQDGDEFTIRIQWAAVSGTAWLQQGYVMGYRVS